MYCVYQTRESRLIGFVADVPFGDPEQLRVGTAEALRDDPSRPSLAGARGELVGVREALGEARARADAAEARSAELSSDLAAERARTETSIAALSALADKLDELVADQRRPWWRRLG